jgi:hypothetical protein
VADIGEWPKYRGFDLWFSLSTAYVKCCLNYKRANIESVSIHETYKSRAV